MELDPSLQRRVEGTDEVLEVAIQGRKAWIQAVVAQQILKNQRDIFEATQAASELGQRMVTIGNWSKLQLSPCLLYTSDAADDLLCVDLGGRRIIKKKKNKPTQVRTPKP